VSNVNCGVVHNFFCAEADETYSSDAEKLTLVSDILRQLSRTLRSFPRARKTLSERVAAVLLRLHEDAEKDTLLMPSDVISTVKVPRLHLR